MSGHDDADESVRHKAPYTQGHKIPTIAGFRAEKETRKAEARDHPVEDAGRAQRDSGHHDGGGSKQDDDTWQHGQSNGTAGDNEMEGEAKDTSEALAGATDPKARRKEAKHGKEDLAEREVTDPVTHLPVTIHDLTSDALEEVPENDAPFGSTGRSATGLSNKTKSDKQIGTELKELREARESMEALFPPPEFDVIRQELVRINGLGVTVGLAGVVVIVVLAASFERVFRFEKLVGDRLDSDTARWSISIATWIIVGAVTVGGIWLLIVGVRDWTAKQIDKVWADKVWEANQESTQRDAKAHEIETVAWLNSLLSSIWPLINPDLFLSLADTLEDVMQASLPSMVQMVSVNDIGQGSENLRILGIRWLPTGAAARSVGANGQLKSGADGGHTNDRKVPGEGEVENDDEQNDNKSSEQSGQQEDGSQQQVAEGMEAEEGDFVNLEIAFAYRTRGSKNSLSDRAKDMHLNISFYLPGKIKVPVWVDLRGLVGTMRLRLQLCPDPPFFSLCTMTLLGQPKVDVSCVPLSRHAVNIMDVPFISNFVQSAVDAAMAEYVAPKSLNLDLKDLMLGDDFKKDTNARGVLMVHIKRGYDFKIGDEGIPLLKKGSSDPYVSVGWAKFGKTVWSTRILFGEMEPRWDETAFVLVTTEELNVDERLRIQLWDSDRLTADDDLGRIELDLKQLMRDEESNGKMRDRKDGFKALKAGEGMPGKLEWSVGYFSKTRIQDCQLQKQTFDPEVRTFQQLKDKVTTVCDRKLREANTKDGRHKRDADELEQQRAQEMKARQDAMIISSPPPDDYPSGVFSIQIHQITGLELEKVSKTQTDKDAQADDEQEEGESLPSAYCTVIINHNKVFKTRTKPKNARPFYNAGTERWVADWRNTEVYISVRDARVKEDDPLLGIVHLPLGEVFKDRAQVNGFYPLAGGVGFGRVRLSMVWRSVQLQAAPEALGWDLGTLEVKSGVTQKDLPDDVKDLKLKFSTNLGSGKMYSGKRGADEGWKSKRNDRSLKLAVHKRYASCLAIQFSHSSGLMRTNKTPAFAVFWLRDIPDEEERELTLPVWRNGDDEKTNFERATTCSLEECGERIGSITLKLAFWSGLGSAHSKWASKDPNLGEVVEVLDTARDNLEQMENEKEAGIADGDASSSDEEGDSSDDDENNQQGKTGEGEGELDGGAEAKSHNGSGFIEKIKEQKQHEKMLNRRNRGMMQWKAPRTAQWAVHKLERTGSQVSSIFKHHTREPGVETEV